MYFALTMFNDAKLCWKMRGPKIDELSRAISDDDNFLSSEIQKDLDGLAQNNVSYRLIGSAFLSMWFVLIIHMGVRLAV
ncbi:hypothetical protein KKA15_04180 [Patescibacteria group bacterium]|nr:hypothetical protein [Patescibacteria group bacterium]